MSNAHKTYIITLNSEKRLLEIKVGFELEIENGDHNRVRCCGAWSEPHASVVAEELAETKRNEDTNWNCFTKKRRIYAYVIKNNHCARAGGGGNVMNRNGHQWIHTWHFITRQGSAASGGNWELRRLCESSLPRFSNAKNAARSILGSAFNLIEWAASGETNFNWSRRRCGQRGSEIVDVTE